MEFDSNNLINVVNELKARLIKLEGRSLSGIESLDNISNDLGVMEAGEFRAGEGTPDEGFSGVRMAYPSMEYSVSGSAQNFNIVGVNNDELQFGLDAETGAAVAGAGNVLMDKDGLAIIGEEPPVIGVSGGTNPGGLTSKHSLHFNDEDNLNTIADIILSNGQTAKGLLMRSGYDDLPLDTFSKIRSQNSHGFVQYHQEVTEGDTADIYVTSDLPLTIDLGGGTLTNYVTDVASGGGGVPKRIIKIGTTVTVGDEESYIVAPELIINGDFILDGYLMVR
jgi:hypothetical protein